GEPPAKIASPLSPPSESLSGTAAPALTLLAVVLLTGARKPEKVKVLRRSMTAKGESEVTRPHTVRVNRSTDVVTSCHRWSRESKCHRRTLLSVVNWSAAQPKQSVISDPRGLTAVLEISK